LEEVPGLFGPFYSAIWIVPTGEEVDISFSGDYNLKVEVGWDDVTGVGTPNAGAFAAWFSPSHSGENRAQ
jgi:hypothetical protein